LGPKFKFYSGSFAHFGGPLGPFRVQGSKSNFTLGHFSFGESPKLKFYFGDFAHYGAHWGLLGFRGSKSNFTLGAFFLLRSLPNCCALCNPCPPILDTAWRNCSRSSTVLPWSGTCE
jgi:hypothetical protein